MTVGKGKFTIIIPTCRGVGRLSDCLASVRSSGGTEPEIIVVDCETPNIHAWIESRFPAVRLLHFDRDIGLSRARNEGLGLASKDSRFIAFLDSDTLVTPGWAESLMEALEAEPRAGAAQACILLEEDPRLLDHTGLALDLLGAWVTTQGLPAKEANLGKREILCASTAAAMVKRDVIEKIGGFDPQISICDEDTDLSWRIWLSGWKVILVPDAVAYHSRGLERDLTLSRIYHSIKNRPYLLLKNSEGASMALGTSLFEIMSLLSVIALIAVMRGDEARQVLAAIVATFRRFNSSWRGHVQTAVNRKVASERLYAQGLLRRDIAATVSDITTKASSFQNRSRLN